MNAHLMVTIDTECDKQPDWSVRKPLSFKGVETGIIELLTPLFESFGVRPTYLLSPEVICNRQSVRLLQDLPDAELGTHLHGDFLPPGLPDWRNRRFADNMQCEYLPEVEGAKLAVLTELFVQQFGYAPASFRAGRFGIGPNTGKFLMELGYKVDTSVTPHIVWTDNQGKAAPDFSTAQELPYRVSCTGNIWESGEGMLMELPVTVLAPGVLHGVNPSRPVWLRPWYSDAQTLCAVIRQVSRENSASGFRRPLVMMFHNVELVPGCSPYPQTQEEVRIYLDQLKAAIDEAATLGFVPCTVSEYYDTVINEKSPPGKQATPPGPERIAEPVFLRPQINLDPLLVQQIVERHKAQSWFIYIFTHRAARWDCWQPCFWIYSHLGKDARILSTGTGAGFNLIWLAQHGFRRLDGFDIDHSAIAAAGELAALAEARINYWLDDGLQPRYLPGHEYDVIEALNWTHLLDDFNLERFAATYRGYLRSGGYLIIDVIDSSFNLLEGNQYSTQDRDKPVPERRASEYRVRMSEEEVSNAFLKEGFLMVQKICQPQEIPKAVYIAQKS